MRGKSYIFKVSYLIGAIVMKGKVIKPPLLNFSQLEFDHKHINDIRGHGVTKDKAISYMQNAKVVLSRWEGTQLIYCSDEGTCYVDPHKQMITTAFSREQYDEKMRLLIENMNDEAL